MNRRKAYHSDELPGFTGGFAAQASPDTSAPKTDTAAPALLFYTPRAPWSLALAQALEVTRPNASIARQKARSRRSQILVLSNPAVVSREATPIVGVALTRQTGTQRPSWLAASRHRFARR